MDNTPPKAQCQDCHSEMTLDARQDWWCPNCSPKAQTVPELVRELRDSSLLSTECTYGDGYDDTEKHPHEEFWACTKCLQNKFTIIADCIQGQELEIARLREENGTLRGALLPAEEGGMHIAVNLAGVNTAEHFRKVIDAMAADLENQKSFVRSLVRHVHPSLP